MFFLYFLFEKKKQILLKYPVERVFLKIIFVQNKYPVEHVSSADSPSLTSTLASPTVTDTSPFAEKSESLNFFFFDIGLFLKV